MDTIVGLGKAGCAIADAFSKYPQYKVFKIDSEDLNRDAKRTKLLKRLSSPEMYESKVPSMKTFFKSATNDVLFVVSGSGMISGATLRILEQLSKMKKNISVLYVKPDVEFLGSVNREQERLVRNVLQEYARSGMMERLYLIDNKIVESVLGDVPVFGYYDKLNDLIVSTFHMINVYDHQKAVHDTPFESSDITKISTVGVVNVDTGEEKLLFPLENVSEKCYYYAVNRKVLETDGTLLRKLTDGISKNVGEEDIKTAFQIHSTTYEQSYGYLVVNTNKTNN
jgi:hypothetical protein